jgi:hypothetical protein
VLALPLALLGAALAAAEVPELSVAVTDPAGAPLPELAQAVGRALGATGARLADTCEGECVRLRVLTLRPGRYRVEVSQGPRSATTTVDLPPDATLLERARALAIEARLLITWPLRLPAPTPPPEPAPSRPPPEPVVVRPEPPRAVPAPARTSPTPAPLPTRPVVSQTPEIPERPAPVVSRTPAIPERPVVSPTPAIPERPAPPPEPEAPAQEPAQAADAAPEVVSEIAVTTEPPEPAVRKPLLPVPLPDTAIEAPVETPRRTWPWIPTVTAAVTGLAAGGCALAANSDYRALTDRTAKPEDAPRIRDEGKALQTASLVLGGVAVVAAVAATVGFALPTERGPTLQLTPLPGGAGVSLAGSLP